MGPCPITLVPETYERLYLCYQFEKNASPEKNITFGRNLLIEYESFTRICV